MPSLPRMLVVFFTLFTFAAATCYWPPGNATYDRDLYEHQPCSNDTTSPLSTICCALNRTNISGGDKLNGRTNDECLPNGICRNRVLDHGTMEVSYWRETCTSRDWKTGLCLDVCADNWTSGNGTTGAIMTPCDDTAGSLKWCCGVDKSCCDDPKQYKLIAFEFRGALPNTSQGATAPFSTPTPSTSSTVSSSATTTAAAATTTAAGPVQEKSSGLSTGAKAGIGIAGAVGGLFLLGLGFFIARRTGNKNPPAPTHDAAAAGAGAPYSPQVPEKEQRRYELDHQMRTELPYSPAQSPGGPPKKMTPSYEMA